MTGLYTACGFVILKIMLQLFAQKSNFFLQRPMFEDDVPSVLELEMEDLEKWMVKDGVLWLTIS